MRAGGHIVVGMLTAAAVNHWTPLEVGMDGGFLILIGALLPDIDHPRSTFGRWNPFAKKMKHRGKTHTILGSLLLSLPFYYFGGWFSTLYVFIGCMSHLAADKWTSFFPRKKPFTIRLW